MFAFLLHPLSLARKVDLCNHTPSWGALDLGSDISKLTFTSDRQSESAKVHWHLESLGLLRGNLGEVNV